MTMKSLQVLFVLHVLAALCCHVTSLSVAQDAAAAAMDTEIRVRRQTPGMPDPMSPQDIKVAVCDGLQNEVPDCRSVDTAENHFSHMSIRQKRSITSYDWAGTNDPAWNNFGSSNTFNTGSTYLCPTQLDQSRTYTLSASSTGYPAAAISAELTASPVLTACLAREIVFDSDPPRFFVDDFFAMSNASCPFQQLRLWSYQSARFGGLCWVVQNFQENLLYKLCQTQLPNDCKRATSDLTPRSTSYSAWWPSIWGSGSSATANTNTQIINRCLTWFETASLWAYCPALPAGSRIVRDRIILPKSCAPFAVPCPAVNVW